MIVKILKIEPVTHDVKRFVVEKPEGLKFTPGQATEMAINKPGWKNELRPFTFTSLNTDPHLEFTIKAYPLAQYPKHGGMTEELHKTKPGDELILGAPFGPIEYKGKGVFIAGGAGITPFIAILRQLYRDNQLAGNQLFFSNKTDKDVIIESELKKMLGKDLTLVFTRAKSPKGEFGHIDTDFLQNRVDDFTQHFYVCGPWSMVQEMNKILGKLGADTQSIIFHR